MNKITVEWAYPSSTHAAKFGFPKSGCWVVYRGAEAVSGHYGRAEADAAARVLSVDKPVRKHAEAGNTSVEAKP